MVTNARAVETPVKWVNWVAACHGHPQGQPYLFEDDPKRIRQDHGLRHQESIRRPRFARSAGQRGALSGQRAVANKYRRI